MNAPIIYNLFPLLVGPMGRWTAHTGRAREMGFNWIFINPVQYPGFSGSLYAVKDYYRLNPQFTTGESGDPMKELGRTIDAMHHQGLKVMMDLVINHTAKDSDLVKEHPEWYRRDAKGAVVSPSAIDPADARNVTVWGDLAEIDNAGTEDREGLWGFWTKMVRYYLELGVDGFRCDAAYKVPRKLWDRLIGEARAVKPDVLFTAETLGCRLAEVRELEGAGFDYLFNSSKWWNFEAAWALEQHAEFGTIAPSIAFPESHDTPRLMAETGGQVQVQKQRYLFSAIFSAGLLMPIGYELCFKKQVNVVRTTPQDWENTTVDLSPFIKSVNRLKGAVPVLHQEGSWQAAAALNGPTTVLIKSGEGASPVTVLINKDWHQPQMIELPPSAVVSPTPPQLYRLFRDDKPRAMPADNRVKLDPAEIVLVCPA